jgi:hypothetical protein
LLMKRTMKNNIQWSLQVPCSYEKRSLVRHAMKNPRPWWFVRAALASTLAISAVILVTLLIQPTLMDKIVGHFSLTIDHTSELFASR